MRISDWSSDVCSSDLDNGVFRNDPGRITPADIDIMTAPIGSVDNQIVAVIRLIGQAALDDTSDDRRHLCRFGDGIVGRRALKAMLGKGALHGPDDVAALTHAAKRIVHAFGTLPAPRFDPVGMAKVPESSAERRVGKKGVRTGR